jgi:hypothetical protein
MAGSSRTTSIKVLIARVDKVCCSETTHIMWSRTPEREKGLNHFCAKSFWAKFESQVYFLPSGGRAFRNVALCLSLAFAPLGGDNVAHKQTRYYRFSKTG